MTTASASSSSSHRLGRRDARGVARRARARDDGDDGDDYSGEAATTTRVAFARRQAAAIAIATTAAAFGGGWSDDDVRANANANAHDGDIAPPPRGYDAPVTSPTGWNTFASSPESLARAPYEVDWPSGWCSLTDVSSARSVGVDASWKDPNDEASTLAIFITPGQRARDVRGKYGSIESDARVRAESAPNQMTIGARTSYVDGPPNRSGRRRRLETHEIETKVGGGTAGRFGSAIELVRIFIVPDEGDGESWEVLIRATASASAWPRAKTRLRAAAASFHFLDNQDDSARTGDVMT